MKESQYYKTRQGYLCFKNSDKPLHRYIAKKEIWEKNRKKYPLEFWEYTVHHKDGDKLNNKSENLELLTRIEHETKHRLERREWDIIRVLVVLVFALSINSIWGFIARLYKLNINIQGAGMIAILIIGYFVILFLNRENKQGRRKII